MPVRFTVHTPKKVFPSTAITYSCYEMRKGVALRGGGGSQAACVWRKPFKWQKAAFSKSRRCVQLTRVLKPKWRFPESCDKGITWLSMTLTHPPRSLAARDYPSIPQWRRALLFPPYTYLTIFIIITCGKCQILGQVWEVVACCWPRILKSWFLSKLIFFIEVLPKNNYRQTIFRLPSLDDLAASSA